MEKTKNFNLNKPAPEDFYNVEEFNENVAIIDEILKKHDDAVGEMLEETNQLHWNKVSNGVSETMVLVGTDAPIGTIVKYIIPANTQVTVSIGSLENGTVSYYNTSLRYNEKTVSYLEVSSRHHSHKFSMEVEVYVYKGIDPSLSIDGKAADAKVVGTQLAERMVFKKITTYVNADDLTENGIYAIVVGNKTNFPVQNWGTLYVSHHGEKGTPFQIFIPDAAYTTYKRIFNDSTSSWDEWKQDRGFEAGDVIDKSSYYGIARGIGSGNTQALVNTDGWQDITMWRVNSGDYNGFTFSNGIWTCPVDGVVRVDVVMCVQDSKEGANCKLSIQSSSDGSIRFGGRPMFGNITEHWAASNIFKVKAGDTIKITGVEWGDGTFTILNDGICRFCVSYI